jgi:hypothetical protein
MTVMRWCLRWFVLGLTLPVTAVLAAAHPPHHEEHHHDAATYEQEQHPAAAGDPGEKQDDRQRGKADHQVEMLPVLHHDLLGWSESGFPCRAGLAGAFFVMGIDADVVAGDDAVGLDWTGLAWW